MFLLMGCLVCTGLLPGALLAQPVRGVVWNPPANLSFAQAELFEIKAAGVEAVRTPVLDEPALLTLADSLGLQFYQDLPFSYLSESAAGDTLDTALALTRELLQQAASHTSVRDIGLARHVDTSDPGTCAFFEAIVQEARRVSRLPVRFYYETTFIEDDKCAGIVDYVLIDGLNKEDLPAMVGRWKKSHPQTPVGFGAVGTWVDAFDETRDETRDGYKLLNSPSYQARYLEHNLNQLFSTTHPVDLASVFVYRWRDIRLTYPSVAHNLTYPYRHPYGLKTNRAKSRASFYVVKGIYTGTQRVFAFPVGQEQQPGASWIILLGWLTIALLGFCFAYFPRFGPNVKRYFAAHGFYRSAVEEGRELLFGPTMLLLVTVMAAFGISGAVILDTVRVTEAFSALVRWMPATMRSTLVALLSNQLILTLVLGSCFAVAIAIWTSILSAITARSRRRLLPGQTFMLIVWPQWPVFIAMVASIVISTLDRTYAPILALAVFVLLALAVFAAALRAYRDYAAITRPSVLRTILVLLGNPFILIAIAGVYLSIQHTDKFKFFWHLITRT